MSLLGPEGLQQVAGLCHHNTMTLIEQLTRIPGVNRTFSSPVFHEVLLTLDKPVDQVLQALEQAGIAGGYAVEQHYPQFANGLLVNATEKRTDEEITHFTKTLKAIMTGEKLSCLL